MQAPQEAGNPPRPPSRRNYVPSGSWSVPETKLRCRFYLPREVRAVGGKYRTRQP